MRRDTKAVGKDAQKALQDAEMAGNEEIAQGVVGGSIAINAQYSHRQIRPAGAGSLSLSLSQPLPMTHGLVSD